MSVRSEIEIEALKRNIDTESQNWVEDMKNFTIMLQQGNIAEQKRLAAEMIRKQGEMQPYINMEHPWNTKTKSSTGTIYVATQVPK